MSIPQSERALIIVDVQPDFCPGGPLATATGDTVAHAIANLASTNRYKAIVTTQDWHIDPVGHFSNTPDYQDTWPVHCLAHSAGAALHPALAKTPIDAHFYKGEYTAAYSGFEGATSAGIDLATWLDDAAIKNIDVVGIATDFCVQATVLDALTVGFNTRVLAKYCAPVSTEGGQEALERMTQAGATIKQD